MAPFLTESYGDTQATDIALCKSICGELEKHYPNHPWMIGVNHEAGSADIRLLYPDRFGRVGSFGFLIHLMSFHSSDWIKKVMLAGGELLERYRLTRGGGSSDSAMLAIMNGIDRSGEIR